MSVINSKIIDGLKLIELKEIIDERGRFLKCFSQQWIEETHINWQEHFINRSKQNVLRGLHFQSSPFDQYKLVTCIYGVVMDVVIDLRTKGGQYGKFEVFNLDSSKPCSLLIPPGCAHGFYVQSDLADMSYLVSRTHVPSHDLGIRWDSVGIPWPSIKPIISERDANLPLLEQFISPF